MLTFLDIHSGAALSAIKFCKGTYLGVKKSRSNLSRRLYEVFLNNDHKWMWDYLGLAKSLAGHGFVSIKRFARNNCADVMFLKPERPNLYVNSNSIGSGLC